MCFFHYYYYIFRPEQSFYLQLAAGFCAGSGKSQSTGSPSLQMQRKIFRKLGSKSNKARCSISVSLRYASFQVLHSLCEIDSQCVENLHPCWHCCADTHWVLWCPWMPEVLPPPLLLSEPVSTSCSFVSLLFVLQNTYLTHSVQRQLCGYNNEVPMLRNFLHAV